LLPESPPAARRRPRLARPLHHQLASGRVSNGPGQVPTRRYVARVSSKGSGSPRQKSSGSQPALHPELSALTYFFQGSNATGILPFLRRAGRAHDRSRFDAGVFPRAASPAAGGGDAVECSVQACRSLTRRERRTSMGPSAIVTCQRTLGRVRQFPGVGRSRARMTTTEARSSSTLHEGNHALPNMLRGARGRTAGCTDTEWSAWPWLRH
jgi:hypothetical protein